LFLFGLILIFSSKAETVDLSTEEQYKSGRSLSDFPYPEIKKILFGPSSSPYPPVILLMEQRFLLQLGLKRERSTLSPARTSEE